jgi:lipopolysaccharide export system permease protein
MFIFIFQSIWLFIDDLAGKGLDMMIIGKFFFYKMPELTEKVLPLTVLLSSILTFGNLAENYEFAAMKASGISLQRAMLPVIAFVVILGGVTFYFANSVIPASEQKIFYLRRNIAKLKPAIAIAEGVFSDFETADMNIKVDRKYGENDNFLENVIIHQKTKNNVNFRVIKAKQGELKSSENSNIIQLVLNDGNLYQTVESATSNVRKYPFAQSVFETYTMNIDLSEFNNVDLEEEKELRTEKMKNISRLRKDIDSIHQDNIRRVTSFSKVTSERMGAFLKLDKRDSTLTKAKVKSDSSKTTKFDPANDKISDLFKDWQRVQLMNSAKNSATNVLTSIKGKKIEMNKRYEFHRRHILSLHKKFALAFSCIILFFVGAPLGAIIRKGGLGLPMVIAIVLFLIYYFLGVFAENYSKKGNIHPMLGAWLSTLVMLPLGVILTRRATADKGLMSFGVITDFFKNLIKKDKKAEDEDTLTLYNQDSDDYKVLDANSDENLIDIAQRYKQYDMDEASRETALHILESRGISTIELKLSGKLDNRVFDEAERDLNNYYRNSNIGLGLYVLSVVLLLSTLFIGGTTGDILNLISSISGLITLIFAMIAATNYSKVRKALGKDEGYLIYLLFFIGLPAYFVIYLFTRKKLKKELKNL